MVRRRLSLPFTDVKEDNEVVADEEINNWKWKSYHEIDVKQNMGNGRYILAIVLEGLEDDLYNCLSSLSLALLYDSLSERSSSSNLKISSLLGLSLMRVLISDLALALHSLLK